MDHMARATSREDSDLATIVLGRTQAGDRRIDAPERVPAWADGSPERGYDARSVVVLALVVAVLAAVVGWSTTIGDSPAAQVDGAAAPTPTETPDAALGDALGQAATAVERSAGSVKPVPAARGANLAAGRLVATRSGSGAGLVTVAVRNSGDAATSGAGADVLVLADGDVMGTAQLGALAAGATARVEVPLEWCPSGTVALVAVVDPGSAVREASEFDNSVSRSASFGC
jgi:hypothetical protein